MNSSNRPTKRARFENHDFRVWATCKAAAAAAKAAALVATDRAFDASIAVAAARYKLVTTALPFPHEMVVWLLCTARLGLDFPLRESHNLRRLIGSFLGFGNPYVYFFPHGIRTIPGLNFDLLGGEYGILERVTKVVIPASVFVIEECAFVHIESITEVIFQHPSALKTISRFAFANCRRLANINVPNSVPFILI